MLKTRSNLSANKENLEFNLDDSSLLDFIEGGSAHEFSKEALDYAMKSGDSAIADQWLKEAGFSLPVRTNFYMKRMTAGKHANAVIPPIRDGLLSHFRGRFQKSTLSRFISGDDLKPEDAEVAANVFTLINALLIAIPFAVLASFGRSFWDDRINTLLSCGYLSKEQVDADTDIFIIILHNNLVGAVYSSICCIVMAALFYILRPKDPIEFSSWWKGGRIVIFALFLGTTATCFMTMDLLHLMVQQELYFTTKDRMCHRIYANNNNGMTPNGENVHPDYSINGLNTGLTFIGLCFFGSIIVML